MAGGRADAPGRLVPEYAAVMGGIADRGADVAARLQSGETGGERRRGSAGRAARRARQVPRIVRRAVDRIRSEEHTSELQSLMRISYAVFCLKKKKQNNK